MPDTDPDDVTLADVTLDDVTPDDPEQDVPRSPDQRHLPRLTAELSRAAEIARTGAIDGELPRDLKKALAQFRVEIDDDGRGLPEDFDWRQSRSLGLSIVNTLIEEMEGTFAIGSRPGARGTRAVFEIPV